MRLTPNTIQAAAFEMLPGSRREDMP